MPEYLSPGVYVEEVDSGARPIEGVGTAMAAFVGFAPDGPANTPALVTNWSQYVETFGALEEGGQRNPHLGGAFLSHAVYGYFNNGGGRCYVTRVVPQASNGQPEEQKPQAQLPGRGSGGKPSLTILPKGTPRQDIEVTVEPPAHEEGAEEGGVEKPEPNPELFTLRVKMGGTEEVYENVSLGQRGVTNAVEAVKQKSRLIELVEETTTGTLAERAPEPGTYTLKALSVEAPPARIEADSFVGDAAQRTGFEGLEVADEVTMVCCPDLMSEQALAGLGPAGVKAVQLAMIAHCESLGDRVAILDAPPDLSPQEVKRWREREAGYDSKFAALYYPWITISGPDGGKTAVPPCGHIAGIYSRNDAQRGVHKAPANEVVRGALEVSMQITKGEQDVLNPIGVNCIRSFTGRGIRVWGARTLSSDPAWRYVNVRRLFNYIEESIEEGTQWIVFEPNDEDLWARVRRDVGAFLTGAWRDGMLFGSTPAEAFYVKCDEELNPPDVRDRGQLVIEVGLAPVKPAEFVVFRFSQWAGGGA